MTRRLGVSGACGRESEGHRFNDFLGFALVETHNMHNPANRINQLMREIQHSKTEGVSEGQARATQLPRIRCACTLISEGLYQCAHFEIMAIFSTQVLGFSPQMHRH